MSEINKKLIEAVNALPEFYQPIYAHPEWNDRPLRECEDRLPDIKKIYDALSEKLQRPLRVLDMGCAQGFFSFNLASWGAEVTGIDFRKQNIALGEVLAEENPDYKIKFIQGRIEEFLVNVKDGEYDLVLGLSVLHNISKFVGLEKVQNLMLELSSKVEAGIFEFALENVHNSYIPKNWRDFLPGFTFIRRISYSTHRKGSYVKRPLCFASCKYCYFENTGLMKIDSIGYNVHPYLQKTDVMHFICGNKFVKFFNLKDESLYEKSQQEIEFLEHFGGHEGLPKLCELYKEEDDIGTRLFIVRDCLQGKTLKEKINQNEEFDRWNVIKQALQWMIFFERQGYYHGDIQTSNFIYSDDGKLYPIDYEEFRNKPVVLIYPYRPKLLFLMFINSVLQPRKVSFAFHREPRMLMELKRHITQKQYEQIAAIKESENFFERLYDILFVQKFEDDSKAVYTMADIEILSMQAYLIDTGKEFKRLKEQIKKLETALEVYQDKEREEKIFLNKLTEIITSQQKVIEQFGKNEAKIIEKFLEVDKK